MIIAVMAHHFKICEGFVDKLKKLHFEIKLVFTSVQDFRYENFSQKITNFLRKTFLGDKSYKAKLQSLYDDQFLTKDRLNFTFPLHNHPVTSRYHLRQNKFRFALL